MDKDSPKGVVDVWPLYKERNFMYLRDVDAYIKKQAGSAAYLINTFAGLDDGSQIQTLFQYWRDCHIRQYDQLSKRLGEKPETATSSFYFDSMYKMVNPKNFIKAESALIHTVSYMRGAMRYQELFNATGDKLWMDLQKDAFKNCLEGDRVCRLVQGDSYYSYYSFNMRYVIECEKDLMKKIDKRIKLTCLRSAKL